MGKVKTENQYQAELIKKLHKLYPQAIIIKNDSGYLQGIPDWTMFLGKVWIWFDVKRAPNAVHQPNQDWYINWADEVGHLGMFVYPENEQEFLDAIQQALRIRR